MDILLLVLIVVISVATIFLWFLGKNSNISGAEDPYHNLPTIFLACWLVASAMMGSHFFVLRIAGIFDITIERLLFVLIILALGAGLFTGKVNLRSNNTIEMAMLAFTLICFVSMIRTGFLPANQYFPSPWFIFITGYLFPFFVFIFAKSYIRSENQAQIIFHTLFYFGIYLCLIAPFEFFDLRQFVFPKYINSITVTPLHIERARGPLLNAAFNGVGILIGFICGLHLLTKKKDLSEFFIWPRCCFSFRQFFLL